MDPDVLVLDEPTAGLDPQWAQQMMSLFMNLNKKLKKTVLMVTHDMEHVLNYCDEVVVVRDGKIVTHVEVREFFKDTTLLNELHILPPSVIQFREMLNDKGFKLDSSIMDIKTLAKAIAKEVKR